MHKTKVQYALTLVFRKLVCQANILVLMGDDIGWYNPSREFEVMQLVITGMLSKQIAGEMGTADKTVKVPIGAE